MKAGVPPARLKAKEEGKEEVDERKEAELGWKVVLGKGREAKEEEGGLKEVERVGAMEKGEEGLVGGGAAAAAKGAAFGKGCGG